MVVEEMSKPKTIDDEGHLVVEEMSEPNSPNKKLDKPT